MTTPFARLLLATEHTEFDVGAESLAMTLAQRCALPLAIVLPVTGNPEFEVAAPELAAEVDARALSRSDALLAAARARQIAVEVAVRHGSALDAEIVAEARERGSDLIVIRRRGRRGFLARLLIGEMVGKVVSNAPCSVLIVPQRATMWTRRVLLGVEPDPPLDDATLGRAAGIAVDCALPLTLVAVAASEAQRSIAQAALDAAAPKARAIGAAVDTELRVGHAATELIAATAARRADLLVVGRRHAAAGAAPRGGIGATAHKVIGEADCAVLVHAT